MLCSRSCLLWQWVQAFPPISLLSSTVSLVLCGGLQSTWTWIIHRVMNMDQFAFLYQLQIQIGQHYLLKEFFSPLWISAFLSKIRIPWVCEFITVSLIWFHWSISFYVNTMSVFPNNLLTLHPTCSSPSLFSSHSLHTSPPALPHPLLRKGEASHGHQPSLAY